MLLLRANTDDLELITSAAGDIEVHLSAMQIDASTPPVVQPAPNLGPAASITTATTTQILDTSGITSAHVVNVKHLNIRNNHASVSNDVTVQINDGTNVSTLCKATLLSGEVLVLNQAGLWLHYTSDGVIKSASSLIAYNNSTAAQSSTFATDTYVTGSFVLFPTTPRVGTRYQCIFDMTKTAAGTATPILQVRVGTAGTTSDTSRTSHTFAAGTAAATTARIVVDSIFRAVGSGTTAVLVTVANILNTGTTGVIGAASGVVNTVSSGFDSTVTNLGIGISFNGGTSFSGTVQAVRAKVTTP